MTVWRAKSRGQRRSARTDAASIHRAQPLACRMALDVLIGLLQAYIFAILATVYVGAALRATES